MLVSRLASLARHCVPYTSFRALAAGHLQTRSKSSVAGVDYLNQAKDHEKRFYGKTGGDIIHDLLVEHDVDTVFGYPGGAILPLFDAIHESDKFNFVLPRHEQGGGHMAQGYARITGKPGVLIVTSGPGGTNTITPMQDALMDGTPMVVLCGQVPRIMQGTDAFQEADMVGMSRSCTKWNVTVQSVKDLPKYIYRAFDVATSGRPGPVLIDLPKDITAGILTEPHTQGFFEQPRLKNKIREYHTAKFGVNSHKHHYDDVMNDDQAAQIADLINSSERPVIYAGHGVVQSGASDLLRQVAEKANIPVTTTLQGMGSMDELHPLSLRMLGMHGSAYANFAVQEADLLIALGARFDDRVTGNVQKFAPKAKSIPRDGGGTRGGIIQFEISNKNINKIVQVDHAIAGNLSRNLAKVEPLLEFQSRDPWMTKIDAWKERYPFYFEPSAEGQPIKPQAAVEALYEAVKDRTEDVIVTTGVGAHQMWACQFFRWRHPRHFISSGGLGTMGYGLPSAIGAQVGAPDKIVVDIDGDASLSMTMMELVTAVQYKIPVKILLLNNDFQGMVKQWQDLFYDERYSHTEMFNPDFVAVAKGMGAAGNRVYNIEDLEPAMKEFVEYRDGPMILEVKVDKREHVYPMVPAGKALDEMVFGPCDRGSPTN